MIESPVLELEIEKLVTGGAGLARHEGGVVFVAGAIPGERVRARVARGKSGYDVAEIVEIVRPSPDRVDPRDLPGGCLIGADLCHMSVPAQHAAKRAIVLDCLARLGGIDLEGMLEGPDAAGPPWKYRNKITLHAGPGGRYGMYRPGTREVVPLDRSPLLPDLLHEGALPLLGRLPAAEEATVRFDGKGRFLVALETRWGGRGKRRGSAPPAWRSAPLPPSCAGIVVDGRVARGDESLEIDVAGRRHRVHATSFFQVNLAETEALVRTLAAWLDGLGVTASSRGGALLDLYGGVGLFTLAFAERFEHVVLVESDGLATRDARENVRRGAHGAEVVRGRVEEVAGRWSEAGFPHGDPRRCVVLVDPPRSGLAAGAREAIAALGPKAIGYVSCDPATLARDCRFFAGAGYRVVRARVFDMFPQTSHVETLLLLSGPFSSGC